MLYYLFYPLREHHIFFNLFRYITFRAAMAAMLALLISLAIGPVIIRKLKQMQIGEQIRADGPQSHFNKRGTPSMGGIIILISVLVPTWLFARIGDTAIWLVVVATVWLAL